MKLQRLGRDGEVEGAQNSSMNQLKAESIIFKTTAASSWTNSEDVSLYHWIDVTG